uniref:Arrestin C-terminal-like domain-containing protein n=1 Tax=Ditylenchus dipsaci TaxID=166011 RepID=A0A915DY99_9BILA
MDYITSFDIRLEKDVYYAGEPVLGCVVLENSEPIKIRGIKVFLRGRSRVQWKVLKSGESRVLKDDQYLLDEKILVWGKEKSEECNPDDSPMQILPRGMHQFNFTFQLPQSQFPCSLETKTGTNRYYVKVIIDIPFASSPQGIKYFTFVGPHIDCMEEKYLTALSGQDHKVQWFKCCQRGMIALRIILERQAYCCGENLKLRAHIENRQEFTICLCIRLFQHIEYRIERPSGSEVKSAMSTVLEYRSPKVAENTQAKFDSSNHTDDQHHPIKIPVVPPTMIGVCRLIQIYYILKVCIEDERKNETLEMEFPIIIATIPYRSTQSPFYSVGYDFCVDYVESGKYISPEFRLGHVYDGGDSGEGGEDNEEDDVILYRPVYVKVVDKPQKNVGKIAKEIMESRLSVDSPSLFNMATDQQLNNKNNSANSLNLAASATNVGHSISQESLLSANTPYSNTDVRNNNDEAASKLLTHTAKIA